MMDVGIFGIGDVPAQPNGMRLPMKWNNTTRPYDRDVRLESLIEARASLHPHDVVAVSDEGELTFSDLDRLANKLANHLLAADVGRGDYVIICLERTNAYLITVLAVLKTGAAFIPIEIEEPASRIAEIAAAEGVAFAVIEQIVAGAFEPLELYTVVLDLQQLERSQLAETRPSVGIASGDGAYGIATSGSSGVPKIVVVAHRSLVNLIDWVGRSFDIGPGDMGLWVSPASFDLSIFDLLGLPALGAAVRIISRDQRRDPIACARMLQREPITFWNSAPALLQTIIPFLSPHGGAGRIGKLRLAFLSGDWIPLSLPGQLRSAFARAEIIALGGATEATVWSNYFPVRDIDPAWKTIPYGRPIQNSRYYILGPDLAACDANVAGELYIAGDCLAEGYLGDVQLTASRFVRDPFAEGVERMYRTGDAARWWPDGTIELLGRLDNQVNVRGYRVDLGEVEVALRRCGLQQAVAVAIEGAAGTSRILAAGALREASSRVNAGELRNALGGLLPSYMIPDDIRLLDSIPLTANGKLDRRAVAQLFTGCELPADNDRGHAPIRTNLTAATLETFLRTEIRVLRPDLPKDFTGDRPFGEIGLGSLEFALLSGRLFTEFGLRMSPVEFYRGRTLSAIATIAETLAPEAPLPLPSDPTETKAASMEQKAGAAAIVGMSCRVAGLESLDEFWDTIRAGRDCLAASADADGRLAGERNRAGLLKHISGFDAKFFGITPREAEVMDPRQRLLLEAAWKAIEHAGEDPGALAGARIGVFVGATGDDFSRLAHRNSDNVTGHTLTGIAPSLLANRISFAFDLRGPSEVVDTACSSSLVALHRAVRAIANGECEAAIVGGVSLMLDDVTDLSLRRLGMLSPDGACKTFDAEANGYARGEGVAVVYLKRVDAARAHRNCIYGIVLGSAVNHNGRSVSLTSPAPEAQKAVILEAYRLAEIDPRTVGLIEAHGTGTILGDPIETRALVDAFAELYREHGLEGCEPHCALSAVKPNVGHSEAAAGLVGLLKAVFAGHFSWVPPSAHFRQQNKYIDLQGSPFFITGDGGPWPVKLVDAGASRRVGVSSFGFGGTNVHVVLECPPSPSRVSVDQVSPQAVFVSAHDAATLRVYAEAYANYFAELVTTGAENSRLADIGFTSLKGRPAFKHRLVCIADTLETACETFRSMVGADDIERVWHAVEGPDWLRDAAHSWVAGRDADRHVLERRMEWDRASIAAIPTYPFSRTVHWPAWAPRAPALVPPPAEAATGEWEAPLAPFAALIADHVIDGRILIPGALFIHLLASLARRLTGSEGIKLERIRFLGNISTEEVPKSLTLSWDRDGSGYRLAVHAKGDDRPLCQAVGRVAEPDSGEYPLPAMQTDPCSGEAVYSSLRARQVVLGAGLQTITEASYDREHCLAVLSAAGASSGPEILDGAFHAALYWQLETSLMAELPIPFSIDRLTIHRPLPERATAIIRATQDSDAAPRITDLTLVASDGRCCVRIEGFAAALNASRPKPAVFAKRLGDVSRMISPLQRDAASDAAVLICGCDGLADRLKARGVTARSEPSAHLLSEESDWQRMLDRQRGMPGRTALTIIVEIGSASWNDDLKRLTTLAKVLARRRIRGQVRLLAMRLAGSDDEDRTIECATGAFARCLRIEEPTLMASSVGLRATAAGNWSDERLVDAVLRHVVNTSLPPEIVVNCTDGKLFIPSIERLEPEKSAQSPYHIGGVYIVTGGLGGLGRLIAHDLALRFDARLMLCGRSPRHQAEAQLAILRRSGAQIDYLQADVTSRDDVRMLTDRTRSSYGHINGVFHAAGVLRDRLVSQPATDDLTDVVRPKLLGARYLDLETRADALDFFVLFSSLAASMGNAGQSGYAFANAWLEGVAGLRAAMVRKGQRSGRSLAVGWGPWRDGTMKIPPRLLERLNRREGLAELETLAGLSALESALTTDMENLLIVGGDAETLGRRLSGQFLPTQEPPAKLARSEAVTMRNPELYGSANAALIEAIAAESKLHPDELDADTRFDEYGIDSVIIMAVTERLESIFGTLPKTLFFEHQTVRSLGEHLAQQYPERLIPFNHKAHEDISTRSFPESARPDHRGEDRAKAEISRSNPDNSNDIAIIGMSGCFPDADDLNEFWQNLKEGRDSVSEVPADRWDHLLVVQPGDASVGPASGFRWGAFVKGAFAFDPMFFHMSKREADMIDPQERLFLMGAYHCLEDAGYPPSSVAGAEIGVFAGVMWGQYEMWGMEKGDAASSYGSIANRVSYSFDLKGPSLAVDSMCSSSLTAIHLACASLRSGESTAALAGGVNVNSHPSKHLFLCKRHFAATDGRCHAFGAGGDGYVAGEGVGVVMLKLRSAAERDGDRILGLIRATAINHDGRTSGYTVPNPKAQTSVVRSALSRAGIDPITVSYIEAHGTGTSLGDPIEVSALAAALQPWSEPDRQCAIGSVKSNIGHAESAAGVAGVIKVILQMHHKSLVPSIHSTPPNPNIAFESTPFRVQRELAAWPERHGVPRRAGVSSFGAGGANAHVILDEWMEPNARARASDDEAHLVPLSAANGERLQDYIRLLLAVLERPSDCTSTQDKVPSGAAVSAANRQSVLLDVMSKTLSLDRRFLSPDDRFDEFALSEAAAATLEANIVAALGVAPDTVRLADCADPAELARQLDRAEPSVRDETMDIADIAYTLQTGRDAMRSRVAILARSKKELVDLLREALNNRDEHPRIWRGTVERVGEGSGGSTEKVFLNNLLRNRRMAKLARLWCEGAEINWAPLHGPGERRRLSLPGYPFAKLVCRVAEPTTLVRGKAGSLDPLIDSIDPEQSINGGGVAMRKSLSRSVFGVNDRTPDGEPSVGPAYMLATAMAAARLCGISQSHGLIDANWTEAPTLGVGVREMLIELTPGADRTYTIRLNLEDDPGKLLFNAVMRPFTGDDEDANWQADGVDSSVSSIVSLEDTSAAENEGLRLMDLLQQGLRAVGALANDKPGPFSGAGFDRLTVHGKLPRKGQVMVDAFDGAYRMLILGDDGTPRLSMSGLRSGKEPIQSPWIPREVVWVRTPEASVSPDATPGTDPTGTRIVLCAGHLEEACAALMRQLAPHEVRLVRLGELDEAEDLMSVIAAPQVSEVFLIVGGGSPVLTPDRLAEADKLALRPLRWLARTLSAINGNEPPPALRVITLNAYRTGGEDVDPIATAAVALSVALGRELPRTRATCVDLTLLANGSIGDVDLRQALRVLREDRTVRSVAVIRDGQVLRRTLRATASRRPGAAKVFHKEHRCLLIGGSGVVGRQLSDELARQYGAHIVWIGRRDLEPEIADATARIEDLGGKLAYIRADVTDAEALRNAFAAVWTRVGPIETVFHCGLDFSVGRLSSMEEAAFAASVGVKVAGSVNLLAVTEEYPVEEVVLMSSAEAFAGNVGWAPYSMACAFQDGLAQAHAGCVLSVNWGYWEGSSRGDPATLAAKNVGMLNAKEALGVLEHALESGLPQVAVFDIGQAALARMGFVTEGDAKPTEQAQPVAAASAMTENDAEPKVEPVAIPANPDRQVTASQDGSSREPAAIEALLRDLLGQVLRISADEIDPEQDIVHYGVDSILIIDFFSLLEEAFGQLPADQLIELQTVREIANYLATPIAQPSATTPNDGETMRRSSMDGDDAFLPGVTLIDMAAPEDADVALKDYPQRLEEPLQPSRASKRDRTGALQFWAVGKSEDALIEIVSRGSGPPVLFLPGIGLTAPVFHEQFTSLSPNWSLFALHPPGHGRSRAPKSVSIAMLADTIAETLSRLGLDRPVHVVASCFGTVPALFLGAHRPELVASLTLCGAVAENLEVPSIAPEGLSLKEAAALSKAAAESLSADFEHLSNVPENASCRETIEAARKLLLHSQRASPAVGMRYLNEILSLRTSKWAPKIEAPTLLIAGTCDTVVSPSVSVDLAAKMPNARLLMIENAGHYPFLTHANEFNSEITGFLKSAEQ
ncbi:amino acid adenylation domain-containing protein [Sinorhizobium medicae]|uniref:amino acid adenylation domain-containing protein n=1 Tax=Sinorhizobium medicae TaxID=110321 RepID=UPI001199BE9D|nr:amino acid adenylation domain-containing protein [Sinorhizobium medicae]TWA15289.1 amino acid adenylation domain-containing protein [Sinorhizobium medicae]TWA35827.1 amino acid adenylation domain-containing protein [Sinorhizobium medicae]